MHSRGPAVGGEIHGGRYEVAAAKGPYAGATYRVEVRAQRKTGKKIPNPMAPGGPPLDEFEHFIPIEYHTNSKLQVKIAESEAANEHNFHLPLK